MLLRKLPYTHPYRWDGREFGGSQLWRPSNLGTSLAVWYDAEDTASITLNGSNVSQWADKSGNGKNAIQSTASNQPEYLATGLNGKPTLNFDATDDVFFISDTSAVSNSDFFIGAIFNYITIGNWSMIAGFRNAVNSYVAPNSGLPILQRVALLSQIGYHNSDTAPTAIKVDVTAVEGIKIATVGRSGGVSGNGGTSTVTSTGASGSYLTQETQTWTSASTSNFQIAGRQQGTSTVFSQKQISEIILCNRNLTTIERQRFEGYLAWKWGLEADLPVAHPFKTIPPYA